MNIGMSRAAFLQSAIALLLSGCGGDSGETAKGCESIDEAQARIYVGAKLREKFPEFTFSIDSARFDAKAKIPFWYLQATTPSGSTRQMLFAMAYCDGSVELSSLMPYAEQPSGTPHRKS